MTLHAQDGFQDTFTTTAQAALEMGAALWARGLIDHQFKHYVRCASSTQFKHVQFKRPAPTRFHPPCLESRLISAPPSFLSTPVRCKPHPRLHLQPPSLELTSPLSTIRHALPSSLGLTSPFTPHLPPPLRSSHRFYTALRSSSLSLPYSETTLRCMFLRRPLRPDFVCLGPARLDGMIHYRGEEIAQSARMLTILALCHR